MPKSNPATPPNKPEPKLVSKPVCDGVKCRISDSPQLGQVVNGFPSGKTAWQREHCPPVNETTPKLFPDFALHRKSNQLNSLPKSDDNSQSYAHLQEVFVDASVVC